MLTIGFGGAEIFQLVFISEITNVLFMTKTIGIQLGLMRQLWMQLIALLFAITFLFVRTYYGVKYLHVFWGCENNRNMFGLLLCTLIVVWVYMIETIVFYLSEGILKVRLGKHGGTLCIHDLISLLTRDKYGKHILPLIISAYGIYTNAMVIKQIFSNTI